MNAVEPTTAKKKLRRVLAAAGGALGVLAGAAGLLCLTLAAPAAAAPGATADPGQLPALRGQAAAVRAEVSRLDTAVSEAVERYNQARLELDLVNGQLAEARLALTRNEGELTRAEGDLNVHLAAAYKRDQPGFLEVLLSLQDFSAMNTDLEYLRLVQDADARAVAELEAVTKRTADLNNLLGSERVKAQRQEQAVAALRTDVERRLTERKTLLASLDAQIKSAVEEQARREAEAAKRLATETGVDLASINGTAEQRALIAETMKYLGIDYVWGGETPRQGFDCSGLVMYVYRKFGVRVDHGATVQARGGTPVPLNRLQPADLVFFGTPAFYHHVGIYIGNGRFIEAPHTGDVVKISPLAGRGVDYAVRYRLRIP